MVFLTGFLIWLAFGLLAGGFMLAVYRAPNTAPILTFAFAIFGAFIGGMLGVFPYVAHNPYPTRVGALIGAGVGAVLFSWIYHLVDHKGT
jgi:uncharacterized membrane protein YeaQ/YmgE (transglycosylase-associated protein family)